MFNVPEFGNDEEDAAQLWNCQFILTGGAKILFTKAQLKHGECFSLLSPNNSGETNYNDEGIPDVELVWTAFVEADIQGEQSHLSCRACLRSSKDRKDEDWKGELP